MSKNTIVLAKAIVAAPLIATRLMQTVPGPDDWNLTQISCTNHAGSVMQVTSGGIRVNAYCRLRLCYVKGITVVIAISLLPSIYTDFFCNGRYLRSKS